MATYRLVFSYTGIQEWLAKLIDHLLDYIEELVATHPSQPPPPSPVQALAAYTYMTYAGDSHLYPK